MMSIKLKGSFFTLLVFFSLFYSHSSLGQSSYGLGFHSHDDVLDKRTSLDLFPGSPWCPGGDFELSFEVSFLPNYIHYFGYIFRMIQDDKRNIDFIYDERSNLHKRYKMVLGEDLTKVAFDLDSNRMFRKWNKFRIRFDFSKDQIVFFTDSTSFIQDKVGLSAGSCFKLYFGTNLYKQFQVTDVPPMKVRNIQITKKEKPVFNWPLDERDSLIVHELVSNADGSVVNPIWMRNEHYTWKEERVLDLNGFASIAFNPGEGLLYITDGDSLFSCSVATGGLTGIPYASGRQYLLRGNQSLYSSRTGDLYNIYVDQGLVSTFDFKHGTWNGEHLPGAVTDYWHFNKFYSGVDSSLYMLGGYGHFQYRNTLFRYHLPTRTWEALAYGGDHLVPRYLSALAATAHGDSVYILGGYGSQTGQQILNPQSIYDMMLFNVKKRAFKKLYEIKPQGKDFVFANSLVLDELGKSYYGLIFSNGKYQSHLQLIKGSLTGPAYELVGDTIPYSFHDIHSFSDLFYSPKWKKFLAVTVLVDSTTRAQSRVVIYSLAGPPVTKESPYPVVVSKSRPPYWIYIAGAALVLTGLGWYWGKRRQKAGSGRASAGAGVLAGDGGAAAGLRTEKTGAMGIEVISEPEVRLVPDPTAASGAPGGSALFLFGEMQIFDKDGIDITRQFTPLLRELFLLILLYSIRKGTGASSEKLTEMLWSDKSTQSARNNRSVNIAKLKSLLDRLGHAQLSKDTGYWKIELDARQIRLDYQDYLVIVKDKKQLSKERINELAEITQRGPFLSNIEYEWLDEFKSEVSNQIVDTYLHFAHSIPVTDDPDFLLKLVNYIFYFDPVNEDAIVLKCKTLAQTGKHSLAKTAFDNFTRQYKTIYGEDYGKDFQDLLEA